MKLKNQEQAARFLQELLIDHWTKSPLVLTVTLDAIPLARGLAGTLEGDCDLLLLNGISLNGRHCGYVSEDGEIYLTSVTGARSVTESQLTDAATHALDAIQSRRRVLTKDRKLRPLAGRCVLLVADLIDDAIVYSAAVRYLTEAGVSRLTIAAAIIGSRAHAELEAMGAEVRSLAVLESLQPLNAYYESVESISEKEAAVLLAGENPRFTLKEGGSDLHFRTALPVRPRGLVIHLGSGKKGTREPDLHALSKFVREGGFAVVTADTSHSDVIVEPIRRLRALANWIADDALLQALPLFYVATGVATAVLIKELTRRRIELHAAALICVGGEIDSAWDDLPKLRIPTYFVVGERDQPNAALTHEISSQLNCDHDFARIADAHHDLHEPGALERAGQAITRWLFERAGPVEESRSPREMLS